MLIALCAALDPRAAHAQLAFGPRTDYAAGSAPSAVAVGDLNRDGLLDFVVTSSAGNSVDAYLGDGFGHFGVIFDSPTGRFPAHVALGDLDGDGILDAVTADRDDNMLSLFRGRGDGSFFPRATINAGPSPVFVAIGDMNGDGRPDLVVANGPSLTVSVVLNQGGAFSGPTAYGVMVSATAAAIGRLDADAFPDVAAVTGGFIGVFRGIGNGGLSGRTDWPFVGTVSAVAIADVNGDGRRDLVATGGTAWLLGVRLGNGDGTFGALSTYATGSAPVSLVAQDLSGDGSVDVVTANSTSNTLSVFAGNGLGGFDVMSPIATASRPRSVAAGDFDGDGMPDLAVANNQSNSVSIFLQVPSPPLIRVLPASLSFAPGFVGFPETLSVRIQNVGSLPLSITQTTIEGSGFSLLDPTSYVLGRGQYLDARIQLAPEAPGSFSGTLTIESTDVGRPSVVVPLSGSMVYPPALEVSPSSLALAALNGASDSRVLELRNQGLGNMTYGLAAIGPQPSWLTFAPTSGSVAPGGSAQVTVGGDATSLLGGVYSAGLRVSSNDPLRPSIDVPITFTVTGTPRISVTPASLDFGSDYVTVAETLKVQIGSIGTDSLLVSGIVSSNPDFSVLDPTSFTLATGGTRSLRVRYARLVVGERDDSLTISSNDVAHPNLSVRLLGSTLEPPVVRVSPTSIDATLVLGDSTLVPLSVANAGGSPLSYSISVRRAPPTSPALFAATGAEQVFSSDDPDPAAARVPAVDTSPVPSSNTGPRTLSATRILVIGDGGTEGDVVPILAGAGYPVTLVADDTAWDGTNPSPDAFGAVVVLDGIDFGDDMPTAGQQALLDFVRGGGGAVVTEWLSYEVSQGRYAIMRPLIPITRTTGLTAALNYSVAVAHTVTDGVSPTFQVTAGVTRGTLNSGTAVVNLSTGDPAVVVKDEGLGRLAAFAVAGNYNGRRPFLQADMRRLLLNAVSWASGYRWLSYDPHAGTVPAGGKDVVNVKLTTAGLATGVELAELLLDSSDPATPRLTLPLRLTVVTGPTPVLASLVSQEVEADRVRMVWQVTGAELPVATVYRSQAGEGWHVLREVTGDGSGMIACEDHDVSPGESYGYRLGLREAGTERIVGETWVSTPQAVLALDGVWPTPSERDLTVSFSLPDRRGGRIELFDVRGRRWMEIPLEHFGPGRHEASLDPRGIVPPGMYWVRLTSGQRSLTARAVLLR